FGAEHQDTLSVLGDTAVLWHEMGNDAAVESLSRWVLDGLTRRLGPTNSAMLTCMHNFADVLQRKGERAQAEVMYRSVFEQRERRLGAHHPDTLTTLLYLAQAVEWRGDHSGTAELY